MGNGDDKKRPPVERQDRDNSEHIERRDYGGKFDKDAIIEKMQRPEPWPDPPSEDSDSND